MFLVFRKPGPGPGQRAACTSSLTIVCCRYRVHGEILDIYTTNIVMFNVAQVFQVAHYILLYAFLDCGTCVFVCLCVCVWQPVIYSSNSPWALALLLLCVFIFVCHLHHCLHNQCTWIVDYWTASVSCHCSLVVHQHWALSTYNNIQPFLSLSCNTT